MIVCVCRNLSDQKVKLAIGEMFCELAAHSSESEAIEVLHYTYMDSPIAHEHRLALLEELKEGEVKKTDQCPPCIPRVGENVEIFLKELAIDPNTLYPDIE